jgi:hypothetical protein
MLAPWNPNVRLGSFATELSRQQVGPCPLCSDSDPILQPSEMSRRVTASFLVVPDLLRVAMRAPNYRTIILISARSINPFYPTKFYMCSRIIERPLERQMSHSSNVVNKRPMLRVAASVILVFCCAAPLVWLFSNLVAYGLRSFL